MILQTFVMCILDYLNNYSFLIHKSIEDSPGSALQLVELVVLGQLLQGFQLGLGFGLGNIQLKGR